VQPPAQHALDVRAFAAQLQAVAVAATTQSLAAGTLPAAAVRTVAPLRGGVGQTPSVGVTRVEQAFGGVEI
jgi:hypothetical protein